MVLVALGGRIAAGEIPFKLCVGVIVSHLVKFHLNYACVHIHVYVLCVILGK